MSELIRTLKKETLRIRPIKKPISESDYFANLTRIEDVLKIVYRRRKRIFGSDNKGTDFSGNNRIKFELWEVQTPRLDYILVLFPNINVSQSIARFVDVAKEEKLLLTSLTILRIDERTSLHQSTEVITQKFPKILITEFTLKKFIKDYCIDSDLTRTQPVFEEPFFLDQPIYSIEENIEQKQRELAIPFLLKSIETPTTLAAYLILAEGGDGKSSLCSSLVNKINQRTDMSGKRAILLRIDEIRQKINSDIVNNFQITSVYDVYDLFTIIANQKDEKERYMQISKNEFEVSVFCGNLVVIIDGLDELFSVFQERFDKDEFIGSIVDLNTQLGESSVILTSRGNLFSDRSFDENRLGVYYLKGFGESECSKYFGKRFLKTINKDEIIRKCNASTTSLMKSCGINRISPFVVDLISIIHSETECEEDNDYSLEGKNYQSNSDLTDKVVFHILRRETQRQEIPITVKEIVGLFCEIVSEYGASIDLEKLKEVIETYYEKQSESVYTSILANPLVKVQSPVLTFRYSFLYNYFITLFVVNGLLNGKTNPCDIRAYSKFAEGFATTNFKDILKFCKVHLALIEFDGILSSLRQKYAKERTQMYGRAISFFVHLIVNTYGQGMNRKDFSEFLLKYFLISGTKKTIKYLFIYGDIGLIDFSGYDVSDSGFFGYTSFLKCNLSNAYFSSTTVDIESNEVRNLQLTRDTFDATCKIGNLSKYLVDSAGNLTNNEVLLRRFFREFLKSNAFVERRVDELRFPGTNCSKESKFFREAVNQSILYVTGDEINCGVSSSGQKSVFNYITNNLLDPKIYKILCALG